MNSSHCGYWILRLLRHCHNCHMNMGRNPFPSRGRRVRGVACLLLVLNGCSKSDLEFGGDERWRFKEDFKRDSFLLFMTYPSITFSFYIYP
ncbi:hypothetical protein SLEP1_g1629 [Rubroshorea leprosula]|uniref:Uncharacterized protein n=1 Tax=Rubroshorea leprosula TaxID=152421 RepID=A0AAV5HKA9_9ROSI|nr:hypothetical protein SLEP1_g1629 [Rubroshorea leprosula]